MPPAAATPFPCRPGCGACCIAPSISTPIPGMPMGKPAGVRCIQLDSDNKCKLFGKPDRPEVCRSLTAHVEMCGHSNAEALVILTVMEKETGPGE
jgi:Fe-S-cluster containining protein